MRALFCLIAQARPCLRARYDEVHCASDCVHAQHGKTGSFRHEIGDGGDDVALFHREGKAVVDAEIAMQFALFAGQAINDIVNLGGIGRESK